MNRNYSRVRDKGRNRPDESNQLQMNLDDSLRIAHSQNENESRNTVSGIPR